MSITDGYKQNFNTLLRAIKAGDVALVEVRERSTGKARVAICAISREGNEYEIAPFALMFDGNPYEELDAPNPDGGFYDGEERKL